MQALSAAAPELRGNRGCCPARAVGQAAQQQDTRRGGGTHSSIAPCLLAGPCEMKGMAKKLLCFAACGFLLAPLLVQAATLDEVVYLDTVNGTIVIKMFPEVAPNHIRRIKELVRSGFYDGIKWHRVMKGYNLAQSLENTRGRVLHPHSNGLPLCYRLQIRGTGRGSPRNR
jgi:hypothetical protein